MKKLVILARKTVEEYFKKGKIKISTIKKFKDKRGVFVTIHSYPENELRGCVGFPLPEYPLYEAVQKAAIEAAFHDGRFSPLRENELNKIVFEVSILDLPKEIEGLPDKKIDKIKKGDGLILECGIRKGLFLPQVWEQLPDKKEFLEALCWKAGLTPDYILDKDIKLYKFSVKAYKESKPKGTVIKIKF